MIRDTNNLPPLIVILGPTASGKTDLAADLARKFNGEIVNADSRQIYQEINIATAKPKFENWKLEIGNYHGIPHHLFNIVKPDENFNVTHFQTLAFKTIGNIIARKKLPFLVGGTGLWIASVVDDYQFPNVPRNEELRAEFESLVPERSVSAVEGPSSGSVTALRQAQGIKSEDLHRQLITKDPAAAEFISAHNRRRIMRALEVIQATGKPFSTQRSRNKPRYRTLELGLMWPLQELEKKISQRLDAQIKEGLEKEARRLFSKYDSRLPALSSISLREWKDYFDGKQALPQTLALIRLHNRQYAKRQMTWFKKDKRIHWIKNKNEALSSINFFLHQ